MQGWSVIVLVMIPLNGTANGVSWLLEVGRLVADFGCLGFFLFLVTFVLFFTHDDGSVNKSLESLVVAFS